MTQQTKNQEIIKELTDEGLAKAYVLTFVFLREYGSNEIKKSMQDLADDLGIPKRTIRHHIYNIDEFGLIDRKSNPRTINSIYLKRYRH